MLATSKITKWGNSQAIRLPKEILTQMNLKIDDVISIDIFNGQIVIKKVENLPSYQSLEQLFADFTGMYEEEELKWGKDRGAESLDE